LGPGFDVLTDLAGAIAGDPGDGSEDNRVIEVVLGELQISSGLLEPCLLLPLLRAQHGELVLFASERRPASGDCGFAFVRVGLRLLEALTAGEVAGHRLAVTLLVLLLALEIGLGGRKRRGGLIDHRLLQLEAAS
jgi:hypothetical protein